MLFLLVVLSLAEFLLNFGLKKSFHLTYNTIQVTGGCLYARRDAAFFLV